jgi:orotate phosphoribosyltransferase
MSFLQLGNFKLASGLESKFRIECDNLDEGDWECLAYLASRTISPFGSVIGIPTGGFSFARAMEKYATKGPRLIVDDVFTTGGSLLKFMTPYDIRACVAFARARPPVWVHYVVGVDI